MCFDADKRTIKAHKGAYYCNYMYMKQSEVYQMDFVMM